MTRAELKQEAKSLISKNYWPIIGATVLYTVLIAACTIIPGGIGAAAAFFIMPIYLGLILYYVQLSDGLSPTIGDMFNLGFEGKYYLRRVGGMAWMALFSFLWSLLFVIPGIVKSYSYAMTPYILAKYPEIPAKEALKLSMKIMNGRKAELFVLHLSFIGWAILSGLTFGLLGVFFVAPYAELTQTLWMKNVMKEVTDSGEFSYAPVIEM